MSEFNPLNLGDILGLGGLFGDPQARAMQARALTKFAPPQMQGPRGLSIGGQPMFGGTGQTSQPANPRASALMDILRRSGGIKLRPNSPGIAGALG